MPQIINTNIASLNAQRNLNKSQAENQQALQRLSSGLRINSARDDAAGLAISTRFTAQVRGLNVAIRNAGDGISLSQTAEGALGAITEGLQRMRELALQASNATNSDSDRAALNAETRQIVAEITRISEQTQFNGRSLLDGSFTASVQIGTQAGETVGFAIAEVTAENLGGGLGSGVSSIGTSTALSDGDLIINGVSIGPSQAADDTSSTASSASSAIAKVAAINRSNDETGVSAEVNVNLVAGTSQAGNVPAVESGSVTLNGVVINVAVGDASNADNRTSVVSAINAKSAQTGVVARDSGKDSGGVILEAEDGRNIELGLAGLSAANVGLATAGTYTGGFTLTSREGGPITVEGGDGTGSGNLANAGLIAGTYEGTVAATVTNQRAAAAISAATLDGTAPGTAFDFSAGNNGAFDVIVDGATINVDLTGNYATFGDLVTALDGALGAAATATDNGGTLQVVSATTGATSEVTFTNFQTNGTTDAADIAAALGVAEDATAAGSAGPTTLASGDLVINDATIGAGRAIDDTASDTVADASEASASAIAVAAAINRATEQTGVSATANPTKVVGGTSTTAATAGDSGIIYVNNVSTTTVTATGDLVADRATAIDAINAISGQTGVIASDNGSSITLTAADGRNVSVALDTVDASFGTGIGLDASASGIGEADISGGATYAATAETTYGSVTLTSAAEIVIESGENGSTGVSNMGFSQGTFGGAPDGVFLSDLDISTEDGAIAALAAVDNALDTVNRERANLGAIQNRLESTIGTLAINVENLAAANSRIQDADFAAESAELSRTQVLQQAGISILSQANAAPQLVLQLLQS